jgi:hypothetical protein
MVSSLLLPVFFGATIISGGCCLAISVDLGETNVTWLPVGRYRTATTHPTLIRKGLIFLVSFRLEEAAVVAVVALAAGVGGDDGIDGVSFLCWSAVALRLFFFFFKEPSFSHRASAIAEGGDLNVEVEDAGTFPDCC